MTSKEEIASQLMRKHGEAKKRCERLAKQDKTSQAYLSAVSDSVLLSFKTVEAKEQ